MQNNAIHCHDDKNIYHNSHLLHFDKFHSHVYAQTFLGTSIFTDEPRFSVSQVDMESRSFILCCKSIDGGIYGLES